MRFAIVYSRFNTKITEGLLQSAKNYLLEQMVDQDQIEVFHAPGAFEAPLIAKKLAQTKRYAGVICLGAVIKGDTAHFEFISLGAATGIMQSMLESETPISFGILTSYDRAQAETRLDKGREAAAACFETVQELKKIAEL